MTDRDAAAQQLTNYAQTHKPTTLENENGAATTYALATKTVGPYGPALLEDWEFVEIMAHFNRERIPERIVHAKGAGAFGYFEVTNDITQYSCAKLFSTIGKKTPIFARFSQVAGELGSADSVRDPRGFAVKFYTDDGVWDLVGNNTPIFFMRDPILFPSFIHTQKRNPVTHVRDWDAYWDWMSLRPESVHQYLFVYSDRGIPDGHRFMNGYGSNTFSLINAQGKFWFCKFHAISKQGIKNLDPVVAEQIAGKDPNYAIRDLYNAIEGGDYPEWNFYIQVMAPDEAKKYNFAFDVTKIWPQQQFPLIPVGKFILNKNPANYFQDVEQSVFSPANFVAGISHSPDRMLQGRLFAYADAHRYRVGVNALQLPVNCPFKVRSPTNYSRDGASAFENQSGAPNYYPNSFNGPDNDPNAIKLQPKIGLNGVSDWYDLKDVDNFSQPCAFYNNVLDDGGRRRLIDSLVNDIKKANATIQGRVVDVLAKVDANLGSAVQEGLKK